MTTTRTSQGRRAVSLLTGAVVAFALLLPTTGAAQEQSDGQADDGGPVVEAARQVTTSPNPTRLFPIPEIAVHPDDPLRLALVAGDLRNGGCFVYTSQDGGLSWSSGVNVAPTEDTFCYQRTFGPASDVQWASDGTLLVAFSGSTVEEDHPNGPTSAYVARSDDGGQTFGLVTVAEGESDAEITTPAGETGPGDTVNYLMNLEPDPTDPDVVYVGWKWRARSTDLEDVPNKTMVAVSTDGGESFGNPVSLTDDAPPEGVEDYFGSDTAMIGVDSQGVAHVVAQERPSEDPEHLLYWQSTDQGETWTGRALDVAADDLDSPDIAVDPSNDNIYVVLSQRTEPEVEERDGWLEPMFLSSTDGGESWSEARNLSTDAEGFSAYFPGISVAPNGRIDVAWHDFRDDPFFDPAQAAAGSMGSAQDQRWSDIYMTSSTDQGASWSDNIRVTDRSIDTSVGATFANSDIRGPIGIASTNAATIVTWPDTRASSGVSEVEDAYVTRVRHSAAAPVSAAAPAGTSSWLWAVLGAAAALILAGLVLLAGTRMGRRSPVAEREKVGVGSK